LSISNNLAGVLLAYTNNSLVINVTATKNGRGLYMVNSHNNVVVLNNFSENYWSGISAISSSKNIFATNNISLNLNCGIRLSHSYNLLNTFSENNTIIGNTIKNNKDGLYLEKSNKNFVCGNRFVENTQAAIVSDESSGSIIRKNMIENNKYGLWIIASRDLIYNNVFASNSVQVYIYPYSSSSCVWNDGYPNGGNFWSDYQGVDKKSGINQDQPGSDGIGDDPYTIDAKNQDRYPLMFQCLENDPPKADFLQDPIEARIEEDVLFCDNSFDVDGQILLNLWNIEGEYYWMSKELVKNFTEEKTKTATLIVFDDNGAISFTSKTFSIRRFMSTLIILAQDKANVGEKIEISAVLMDEDNNPIVGALVYFYLSDSSFEDFIGSALTNSFGVATFYYYVEKEGSFQLKALFMGNEKYAGTSIDKSLIVKGWNPYTFWILTSFIVVTAIFAFLRFKKRIKMRHEMLGKL
jgi:parallel beta-helix repeat protein